MTDAETIAVLQKMRRLANDNIPAWPEGQARREISGICTEAIAALRLHESQKQLQADTNAWHEHGMIAPSCVGCPTAEEALKRDESQKQGSVKAGDAVRIHTHKGEPTHCFAEALPASTESQKQGEPKGMEDLCPYRNLGEEHGNCTCCPPAQKQGTVKPGDIVKPGMYSPDGEFHEGEAEAVAMPAREQGREESPFEEAVLSGVAPEIWAVDIGRVPGIAYSATPYRPVEEYQGKRTNAVKYVLPHPGTVWVDEERLDEVLPDEDEYPVHRYNPAERGAEPIQSFDSPSDLLAYLQRKGESK